MNIEIFEKVKTICTVTKASASQIATASTTSKNKVLANIATFLRNDEVIEKIIAANLVDISAARDRGTKEAMIDRLSLNKKRICGIADSIDELILLSDPIGVGECFTRPNGLEIKKVCVPIGVIGIIYESRPNVTIDAASLCIKSGNAAILRGGSEAINSNIALVEIIKNSLEAEGISKNAVTLIADTSRESSNALMQMRGIVDVLIPRGGAGLIRTVVENSEVPIIETGAGNCHIYVDESADINMAVSITINSKASRPSVCNSAETLLINEKIAEAFLSKFLCAAKEFNIELRGCEKTRAILTLHDNSITEATEQDYLTEYNDYILAVKIVSSVEEAAAHIDKYSTRHSDAIITKNMDNARYFERYIDSAAVYVNASTRFTDGGEFGLGAEIGISTQKLHVRGPMGLMALTSQKYIINGNGQIR